MKKHKTTAEAMQKANSAFRELNENFEELNSFLRIIIMQTKVLADRLNEITKK